MGWPSARREFLTPGTAPLLRVMDWVAQNYNRPMPVLPGDPRLRTLILLAGGALLLFAFLGALQAFNVSEVRFLEPVTSAETLAFVGLIVLVFLLLMLLLTLLFRNILKLYADQGSSALGTRLRTRMVLGAALIALIPAVDRKSV